MINDNFLNEIAKAINSESYVVPSYITFGTSVISAAVTDTVLSGETGTRISATKTRSNNVITHNALKTGSTITSSTGTVIYSSAMFSALTSGTLMTEIPISAGITHTTAFDIEVDWYVTIDRQS